MTDIRVIHMSENDKVNIRAKLRHMCLYGNDASHASEAFLIQELRTLSLQCKPCHSGALQDHYYYDANLFGHDELMGWLGEKDFNTKMAEVWRKILETANDNFWRFPTNFDRSLRSKGGGSGQKAPCIACFSILLKYTPRFQHIYDLWDKGLSDDNKNNKNMLMRDMLRVQDQGAPPKSRRLNNNPEIDSYQLGDQWDDIAKILREKSTGTGNGIIIEDEIFNPYTQNSANVTLDDVKTAFREEDTLSDKQTYALNWIHDKEECTSRWVTNKSTKNYFIGLKLCNEHAAQVRTKWPDTIIVPSRKYVACEKITSNVKCTRKAVSGYSYKPKEGNVVENICATCLFEASKEQYDALYKSLYSGSTRINYKRKEKTVLFDVKTGLGANPIKLDEQTLNTQDHKIKLCKYNTKTLTTSDGSYFVPDLLILVYVDNVVKKLVVLEVDEMQHMTYKPDVELLREENMCEMLKKEHNEAVYVHIIRFNPDAYNYYSEDYPTTGKATTTNIDSENKVPYYAKSSLETDGCRKDGYDARLRVLNNAMNEAIKADINADIKVMKTYLFYDEIRKLERVQIGKITEKKSDQQVPSP